MFLEAQQIKERGCLSSIILSPLNGYVKMSPYETGDICIEPERIATSGGDFILPEGGPCVCLRRPPAPPNAPPCENAHNTFFRSAGDGPLAPHTRRRPR